MTHGREKSDSSIVAVKLANKHRLAALIAQRTSISVSPESLFDVQVKRIHEYKRQHLAALHILTLYLRLRREGVPRAHAWRRIHA